MAGCLAVAALSLLVQRTPDFDPTAWLIWGRQLGEGTLSTTGGPSWKPLPVLFTTPLSLLGDTAASTLWLFVARAGGLLAVLMCFRVTARLGGRVSGLIAATGLALSTGFLYTAMKGDAEGLLVLLGFLALDAYLCGRPRLALVLGAGTGLIRPETWPLIAAYGAFLMVRDRRASTWVLVPGVGVAMLALWLVPEHAGSGEWLRAATRAQQPAPGSPGQSAFPFGMTFVEAAIALMWPLYLGAIAAVLRAWRQRDRLLLSLAGAATVHMILVATMAEAGFTGNRRYVTLPAALLCVLGGLGLPPLIARLRSAATPRAVAAVLATAGVALSIAFLVRDFDRLERDERVYGRQLSALIDLAGSRDALVACGPVGANHFARQMVAWRLDLRQEDIRLGTQVRDGTVFAREGTGAADATDPPLRRYYGEWELRSSC